MRTHKHSKATDFTVKGRGLWQGRVLLFESLPSTNRWAMSNLSQCRHGDAVRAVRQTEGVGRFSRSWASPDNRGLAVSVVLRETELGVAADWAGQLGAIAVRAMLETFSIVGSLKWPNDVAVGGKKISGVLAERDDAAGMIVLGMGVNVNVTTDDLLAARLAKTATSMRIERGASFDIDEVCRRLLAELEGAIGGVASEGAGFVTRTWREHDWLASSDIEVDCSKGCVRGAYRGMDESGRLLLVDESGGRHSFWSGDVRMLVATRRGLR